MKKAKYLIFFFICLFIFSGHVKAAASLHLNNGLKYYLQNNGFYYEDLDNVKKIVFSNIYRDENVISDFEFEFVSEFNQGIKYGLKDDILYIQFKGKLYLHEGMDFFREFKNVEYIEGLKYIDTSNVTYMTRMFYDMNSLKELDLSSFNTSNVIDMSGMFSGDYNLTSLNIKKFDTSNVKDMNYMFASNKQLKKLNLNHFVTSNVTNFNGMFRDMENLTSLNIDNFDTSKVTDMSYMFYNDIKLAKLNIKNFNTTSVRNMSYMFKNYNDSSLDLSSFDTSKVTNMSYMFDSTKLKKIIVSEKWNTDKLRNSNEMFNNSLLLTGEFGFKYNNSLTDKSMAIINTPLNDGYLSMSDNCLTNDGFITIDGNIYFYDENGNKKTGIITFLNDKYYFDDNGVMKKGIFVSDNKNRYFFSPTDYKAKKGWFNYNNNRYYADKKTSVLYSGFKLINGNKYFFSSVDNKLKKGWFVYKNNKFYSNTNTGEISIGLTTIDSKRYYFDENGVMQIGIILIGNDKYYFDSDGVNKKGLFITDLDGSKYFFSSNDYKSKKGWFKYNNNSYYADLNTGVIYVGKHFIDGNTYIFDANGILINSYAGTGYTRNYNYTFYKTLDSNTVNNKDDVMLAQFKFANSGEDSMTFICDINYSSCIDDFTDDDFSYLGYINPFYQSGLSVSYSGRRVTLSRYSESYNDEQITYVNNAIDNALGTMNLNNKTDREKVKEIHDYIADNTRYDTNPNSSSYRAYGLFENNKAVCNGYADTVALFLDRIGIPNIEISNDDHKWNLVYVDNKWSHLDVTWDDPIVAGGGDIITYDYFLIDTAQLLALDTLSHTFDTTKYLEAN